MVKNKTNKKNSPHNIHRYHLRKQNIKEKEIKEGQNLYRQIKIRYYQQEKGLFFYETFYTNLMVITKHISRAET